MTAGAYTESEAAASPMYRGRMTPADRGWVEVRVEPHCGSGCRAATTPPRSGGTARTDHVDFAGSSCAAARGATRRSPSSVAARATPAADALQLRRVDARSSTTLSRYGSKTSRSALEWPKAVE